MPIERFGYFIDSSVFLSMCVFNDHFVTLTQVTQGHTLTVLPYPSLLLFICVPSVFVSVLSCRWCDQILSSGWTFHESPFTVTTVTNRGTYHFNQVKRFAHLCAHIESCADTLVDICSVYRQLQVINATHMRTKRTHRMETHLKEQMCISTCWFPLGSINCMFRAFFTSTRWHI